MNEIGLSKSEKEEKLSQILSKLKEEGNFSGVIFSYRDGGVIKEVLERDFDYLEFVSMCASVLESALGLSRAMGDVKIKKIISELSQHTVLMIECDEKTFLILIIKLNSHVNNLLKKIEEYVRKIIFLY